MVRPKAQRRIQVEEPMVSPSEPSCDISTKLIRPIKFLTFTLNTFSFSSNPAPGKVAFAMINVARAGEEDGEAKGAKKDPG